MPWRMFLARTAVVVVAGGVALTVAVFVGMRLATADPGGPTRDELTFAGVLRDVGGSASTDTTPLRFVFRRGAAAAPVCEVTTDRLTLRAGAFTVPVPISRCAQPRALFDGEAVTYEVFQGSVLLTDAPVSITPVPYARFADQVGVNNDCPVGYELDPASPSSRRYCRRSFAAGVVDEVVRVGEGASSFWIDRYEAMICDSRSSPCSGLINNRSPSDLTTRGLPPNGIWVTVGGVPPLFARSLNASNPPVRWVTWFQADALCRASGKRLPTGSEWLAAARGTGGTSGDSGCLVSAADARDITSGSACTSEWGAQDMVGNVSEWTAEWYASVGFVAAPSIRVLDTIPDGGVIDRGTALAAPTAGSVVTGVRVNERVDQWGDGYNTDGTWNISSVVDRAPRGGENNVVGIPAAALRGGDYGAGSRGGVFALDLSAAPTFAAAPVGFRCVIPR